MTAEKPWKTEQVRPREVHVHPLGDVVAHELTWLACPCGPRLEVLRVNSHRAIEQGLETAWLVTHNSADGREALE